VKSVEDVVKDPWCREMTMIGSFPETSAKDASEFRAIEKEGDNYDRAAENDDNEGDVSRNALSLCISA